MLFLYQLGLWAYRISIRLASYFHPKARHWVAGRRNWRSRYAQAFQKKCRVLWVHAASLGEFEQGRPLIEDFRARYPEAQVVLTFFSPSGFEIRKNYAHADLVAYLPPDSPDNARDFLAIVQPDLAVFVKYEFWYHYLHTLTRQGVPVLLVSGIFRPGQPFFRWYGAFWRRMLACFSRIFVQQEDSARLLAGIGVTQVEVAGDTRIDRVLQLAASQKENPVVAAFAADGPVLIAGSTWMPDERIFLPVLLNEPTSEYKLIIAPHDPSPAHIRQMEAQIETLSPAAAAQTLRYSRATPENAAGARILVIDNVGLLNTIYRYGTIAWIGGGFGAGIHNTLEPAAYGLPVIFGPKYEKFEEARQLLERGAAFSVDSQHAFRAVLQNLSDPMALHQASAAARQWLRANRGATGKIMEHIQHILPK